MTRTGMLRTILGLCAVGLLLSMLCYPFGYDQAVFAVGGKMAFAHGATAYSDFLDTKPPLIFYIYGLASAIFGSQEWSIRALDIFYQFVTLFIFYGILRRRLKDEQIAFLSVILYTLLYVTSGYWMTAQTETFAMLPAIWLFSLTELTIDGNRPLRNGILCGMASALLFLTKFTLLCVPLAAVCCVLLSVPNERRRDASTFLLALLVTVSACILLFVGFLYATGGLPRFLESFGWLRGYSSVHPLLSIDTLGNRIFKDLPIGLIVSFSLSGIIFWVVGATTIPGENRGNRRTYHHLIIQVAIGLLTVIYERKFSPYHYSRVYWCAVPIIAIGLRSAFRSLRDSVIVFRQASVIARSLRGLLIVGVVAAAAFYSPLPRIFVQPIHWAALRFSGGDIGADIGLQFSRNFYGYADQKALARILSPSLGPTDDLFLWGNGVGAYFWLNKLPTTICLTNTPFVTSWTPPAWKATLLGQLQAAPPKFFVVETEDDREDFTGDTLDSRQHLEAWTDLSRFVHSNYHDKMTVGHFIVLEQNR